MESSYKNFRYHLTSDGLKNIRLNINLESKSFFRFNTNSHADSSAFRMDL